MIKSLSHIALLLCCLFLAAKSSAQNILIDEGGGTPESSSVLELRSTDKGFLAPRMPSLNRLAIASPAKGLLVYQTNGLEGFYYYNGDEWDTLDGHSIVNSITEVTNSKIAVVRDIKASGVDGGDFNPGSWEIRDLNDLQGDSSFISIDGTSKFSLDSGIYEVSIIAPGRGVGVHQIRLYNVDSSSVVSLGATANSATASTNSEIYSVFTLTVTTEFEVQHQCAAVQLTDGKGSGINWGDNVFTQVKIQKY